MIGQLRARPLTAFAVLAAGLVTVEAVAATAIPHAAEPRLVALALAVDLAVGLPLLGWLTLVRRGGSSSAVAVPLALLGLTVAWVLLPEGERAIAARALPLVEGAVVLYAAVTLARVRLAYRAERTHAVYPLDALRTALSRVLGGRWVALVAAELGVVALAVTGWGRRYRPPPGATAYPSHIASGYVGTVGALMAVVGVETVAVHLLVARRSQPVAWALTALSAYTLVWLAGDLHGVRLHPHVLSATVLHLRAGLRARIDVPLADIAAVRSFDRAGGDPAVVVSGEPNLVVELRRPQPLTGLLGRRREVRSVAFAVDDHPAFLADLLPRLS